jgi:FecR protein
MLPPRFTHSLIACRVSCLAAIVVVGWSGPVLAQTPLTKATVASFRNQVNLMPRNQRARPVKVADQMKPGDGLATARSARADLRFNDGSLARIGQQVVFRFTVGNRNLALSNGTLLLLIPPGQGKTQVNTPNAVTGIQGSALFIRYDPVTDATSVGALTDSGIKVWNRDQTESRTLKAGQLLVVTQGPLRDPVNFDLQTFYQTSLLAEDLRLNDAGFVDSDAAIAQVRRETLAGVAAQTLATQRRSPKAMSTTQPSIQDRFFTDRSTPASTRSNPLPTGTDENNGATTTETTPLPATPALPSLTTPDTNTPISEAARLTQSGSMRKVTEPSDNSNGGLSVNPDPRPPVDPPMAVNPPNPTTPPSGADPTGPVAPPNPTTPPSGADPTGPVAPPNPTTPPNRGTDPTEPVAPPNPTTPPSGAGPTEPVAPPNPATPPSGAGPTGPVAPPNPATPPSGAGPTGPVAPPNPTTPTNRGMDPTGLVAPNSLTPLNRGAGPTEPVNPPNPTPPNAPVGPSASP